MGKQTDVSERRDVSDPDSWEAESAPPDRRSATEEMKERVLGYRGNMEEDHCGHQVTIKTLVRIVNENYHISGERANKHR